MIARKRRKAELGFERAPDMAVSWTAFCMGREFAAILPRPRIEDLVERVGKQVERDEDDADQQHAGHDRVHVADQHVVGDVLAETRPREYRLDEDRTFE